MVLDPKLGGVGRTGSMPAAERRLFPRRVDPPSLGVFLVHNPADRFAILGACLAEASPPRVAYGYAGSRATLDPRGGPGPPRRREPLRARQRGAAGDAGPPGNPSTRRPGTVSADPPLCRGASARGSDAVSR